ncbi:MAG: MBL fold metallo-hydrolase [Candidatus Nanopelagicales bacterium]
MGSAGSFPNSESAASCYLLEHDGHAILLDLGSGSIGPLQHYRDLDDIDGIAISHLHIDHCSDIGSMYVARRYNPKGALPKVPVLGPVGTSDRMSALYGLAPGEDMSAEFEFREYAGQPFAIGPFTITAFPVVHCITAFAIKVEAGGRTLIYSGDTALCPELIDASVGADVALYEASYLSTNDNPPNIHMTGRDAGVAGKKADIPRLVLTHLVAWTDNGAVVAEAIDEFGTEVQVATPGLVIDI